MNVNAILALLELKGIISRDEGEKIAEHINNFPQSTFLADAVEQVKNLIENGPKVAFQADVKSVETKATKAAKNAVKEEAGNIVDKATTEASKVAETVAADAAKAAEPAPVKNQVEDNAKK